MTWRDHDHPTDPEPDEPTWPELMAMMMALRDRETSFRRSGRWEREFDQTELLESLIAKLRRRFRSRRT